MVLTRLKVIEACIVAAGLGTLALPMEVNAQTRMTSLLLYLQGTSESWPIATGKHDLGAVIEWQWERASPR